MTRLLHLDPDDGAPVDVYGASDPVNEQLRRTVIAWSLVVKPGKQCVLWDLDTCRCGPAVRVDLAWIAEIQASGARLTVDDRIRDQSARFDVACRASATRDQASATDPIMTQNYAAHLDSLAAHRAVLVGDQVAHVVDGCFDRLLISMPSRMNSRCHWWKLRTSRGGFYAHSS